MNFRKIIALLMLFFINSAYCDPVYHYHGERFHQHMLPSSGVLHKHGNGIVGSAIHRLEYRERIEQKIPNQFFLCENLPQKIKKSCMDLIREKTNNLNVITNGKLDYWDRCYVKGSSNKLVNDEKNVFSYQLISGMYANLISTYDNFAMCHWSSNNFKAAKYYIDNFDLLLDIIPIIKETSRIRIGSGRALPDNQDGYRWHISHQAVRFIENTLRTWHKSLCKGTLCQDFAWKLTQEALANNFERSLVIKLLDSSNNKTIKVNYNKRERLIAQKSLLLLAARENIIPQGYKWSSYIDKQINRLTKMLYRSIPELRLFESHKKFTIKQVKRIISRNETIITYLHSIECRAPIVWVLNKRKTSIKRAGTSRKECTTAILKQKIFSVKQKIINNDSLDSLQSDLTWLSKQLIYPIKLPKAGSKLIIAVDEIMAALPFELLKTSSGKRLGDIYSISYTPSIPLFTYLKTTKTKHYKVPYVAFSKDKHGINIPELESNKFISFLAEFYKGKAYTEAKEIDLYNKIINGKVLHFITHSGKKNGKHGLFYGRSKGDDGIVTGEEIVKKANISAETILITSCDSAGTNAYQEIGEAYSNLSKGFLISGAKRVVITRWPVEEKVAKQFVTRFLEYTEKKKINPSLALQKIRNELRITYPNNPKIWIAWIILGS